jgi:glycosyltransferase involved in cell wall biosynthesis
MDGHYKKLLLVLTEFPPSIGGMQTHARYLSGYLADRGFPIEVVTYRAADAEEGSTAREFDSLLDFPVHRSLSRLSFWHNVDILKRLVGHLKPDLVYCSTVFYGQLRQEVNVPVICRSAGNDILRPWIVYPFRYGSRWLASPIVEDKLFPFFKRMNSPEIVNLLLRRRRYALANQGARSMDLIIANSHFTASLLQQQAGVSRNRVRTVVGGVDAGRFAVDHNPTQRRRLRQTLEIPEHAYVIVTACRLVAKKGVDFLLRAFCEIHRRMPDTHLIVVGDGRFLSRYQRLALSLDIAAHVTFTGRVNHMDIHRYYWLSDLFVLASRIQVDPAAGIRDAETMGRVLCEANAAGVPVIAARSGGIPSVIDHEENGLLFTPDDEGDFLRQIQRIRADPLLREKLVQNGRQRVRQQFDWSVVMQAHLQYFDVVLNDHNGQDRELRDGGDYVT